MPQAVRVIDRIQDQADFAGPITTDQFLKFDNTGKFIGVSVVSGGDLNFVFNQQVPLASWTINHNLGKFPSVTVVDSAKTQVIGDVQHLDTNTCIVSFAAAFAGSAYLN